jgi:hypothetical protein
MRYSEFRTVTTTPLFEAARIQHAEDIIFWEGSAGAARALESFRKLEQGGHQDVTVKWDGSPAIIFGRNENGEFVLTDKSGFGAKGYDGKATSGGALQKMLMARPGAQRDPEGYGQFAANMKDIFDEYEKATPNDFRGYLKGDLLYFNKPQLQDGKYKFTPNIVTYEINPNSDIGKRVGASKSGVVIHRVVDEQGNESPLSDDVKNMFLGNEVFVVPPVQVVKAPQVSNEGIDDLKQVISKNATAIDKMLNQSTLLQLKLADFSQILYNYTNSKVDTGIQNLGSDFMQWLKNSKVSQPKQQRITDYIQQNQAGFTALWMIVNKIMGVKNDIINQFDKHDSDVKASIGPGGPAKPETHGKGGEGYVLAHPEGDIKLVSREYFSKANRSVER